jgi:hypothetical protein
MMSVIIHFQKMKCNAPISELAFITKQKEGDKKKKRERSKLSPQLRGIVVAAGCKNMRSGMKRNKVNTGTVPLQSGHTSR